MYSWVGGPCGIITSLALSHIRHATLLYLILDFHAYDMLRYVLLGFHACVLNEVGDAFIHTSMLIKKMKELMLMLMMMVMMMMVMMMMK